MKIIWVWVVVVTEAKLLLKKMNSFSHMAAQKTSRERLIYDFS